MNERRVAVSASLPVFALASALIVTGSLGSFSGCRPEGASARGDGAISDSSGGAISQPPSSGGESGSAGGAGGAPIVSSGGATMASGGAGAAEQRRHHLERSDHRGHSCGR